ASAVGLPQPSEAATASAGSEAVSPSVYRFDVIGSAAASVPQQAFVEQQEASPPATTFSAALPYLSFTTCLMSWSAMAWPSVSLASLRAAARRGAAGARLGQGESRWQTGAAARRRVGLVLEIVVQVVHLPLDAVGILHPELVLVGVAAVHAHLLAHREPRGLDARELRHHVGRRLDLHPEMVHRPCARTSALGQRQVHRAPRRQELHVARLLLDRIDAEERAVELPTLA